MSSSITAGTDDAVSTVKNVSFLVFGIMGIGTFLLFFFFIVLLVIFIFSTYCTTANKVAARAISTLLFIIVFLVLIFAQQQGEFKPSGYEQEVLLCIYI